MKRGIFIAIAVVIIAGTLWLVFGRQASSADPDKRELQTLTVGSRTVEQFVNTNGTVRPSQLTDVRSEVSGRIVKVFVREGEVARPGQPLLELDQQQLRSDIKGAELQIESARLRAEQLQVDLNRKKQLAAEKLIPDKDITDARAESGRADIEVEIQQAKLDRLKTELAKTTITAPIDGAVLNLTAREGMVITGASSVSEGTVLLQLADLERLEVESNVNEIDVARLSAGMPVDVTFDSAPGAVTKGRLTFVAPSAGSPSPAPRAGGGAGNAPAARDFRMIAALEDVGPSVKPGMSANLKILVGTARDVPAVEISAIFVDDDGSYVFARKGETFERRKVETGLTDLEFVQIKSGLANGDVVSLERPPDAAKDPEKKP